MIRRSEDFWQKVGKRSHPPILRAKGQPISFVASEVRHEAKRGSGLRFALIRSLRLSHICPRQRTRGYPCRRLALSARATS